MWEYLLVDRRVTACRLDVNSQEPVWPCIVYRTIAVLKPLCPKVSFEDISDTNESNEEREVCVESANDTEPLSPGPSYRKTHGRLE